MYQAVFMSSTVLYILVACFLTWMFILHVDQGFDRTPRHRLVFLALTAVIGCVAIPVLTRSGMRGHLVTAFGTVNLIVFACLCASAMSGVVKRPAELVPVCAVAALADLFSVFSGPTKQLAENVAVYYQTGMKGPPPFVDYILVKGSMPGMAFPMPLFGVSDWIVVAFLSMILYRFGMSDRLPAGGRPVLITASSAGLAVSILTAQATGRFLPALPFVTASFLSVALIRYPEMRKLEKKDWILLWVFSVVMVSMLVIGLFLRS
jgi:FtsH-binding integral membrane protein